MRYLIGHIPNGRVPQPLSCRGYGRDAHPTSIYRAAGLCDACWKRARDARQGEQERWAWQQMKSQRVSA